MSTKTAVIFKKKIGKYTYLKISKTHWDDAIKMNSFMCNTNMENINFSDIDAI
jgi:Fe-S cluster biosynthesis and repair protein YggX